MNSPDHAIFYGTTYARNPNEIDGTEASKTRQARIDSIMDALTIDCVELPIEVLDDNQEIAMQMWAIITDSREDKLGRLNDVIRMRAEEYAKWKVSKL